MKIRKLLGEEFELRVKNSVCPRCYAQLLKTSIPIIIKNQTHLTDYVCGSKLGHYCYFLLCKNEENGKFIESSDGTSLESLENIQQPKLTSYVIRRRQGCEVKISLENINEYKNSFSY
jgi:hypothetical protein